MANSKYEYVKNFETDDRIIPDVFIVVRVDGRAFGKLAERHCLSKPVDERLVALFNDAAARVLQAFTGQIPLAYGHSDEYSFVFRREVNVFRRRASKLLSVVTSLFSSAFVRGWESHFGASTPLQDLPSFDGRVVVLPSFRHVRDYLSWRQVDCHINCQYNTAFWLLVQKDGLSKDEAHSVLRGTDTGMKNEIMWQRGTNYNDLPEQHRKGSLLVWRHRGDSFGAREAWATSPVEHASVRSEERVLCLHCDLIRAPDDEDLLFGALRCDTGYDHR
jgi:tRNA(His) guanylyltransferase